MASTGYVLAFVFHHLFISSVNWLWYLRLEKASLETELCDLCSSRPPGCQEVQPLARKGLQCPCVLQPSCIPVSLVKADIWEARLALGSVAGILICHTLLEVQTGRTMWLRKCSIDTTCAGLCGSPKWYGYLAKGLTYASSYGRPTVRQVGC